ncbi:MAG: ABC transporter ATP-binding protein [Dehalococcoidales bacterium]|nr:ABC transporter ATP-binding protein [Dehalococcoidales bacterium]
MIKLIKHLKPFTWAIVVIFALLFGQAMTELALPGYMADIVNVGIQGNGIENAVPEAMRTSTYDRLISGLDDSDQEEVADYYLLLSRETLSESDYARYVEEYPALSSENIYKLNTDDSEAIESLDELFTKAIIAGMTGGEDGILQLPDDTTVLDNMVRQAAQAMLTMEYEAIGIDLVGIQSTYILRVGGIMLLFTFLGAAASIAVGYLSARTSSGLARNLRKQAFVRVEDFSNTEFDKFSTASLITRSTNDITQVQMLLVMLFRIAFYAPILGIGAVIKVISGGASMSWIIAAAVLAMMVLIGVLLIVAVPKFKIIQKLIDKVNLVTRQMLSGIMVIRAFNTQNHEEKKFDDANQDLTKTQLFITRVIVFLMPVMMLIMNVVMITIVWVGAYQVDAGTVQVGDMMAFMQYTMQIIMAFMMVSMVFVMLPRAIVSTQRINEVLDTEPVIKNPKSPVKFKGDLKGQLEFKDVFFRYPSAEEDLLKNINFTAKPGQTTAIIGSTGSGKSTMINLIPRFYDVTSGKILVNGLDIRDVTQHDLREKIGYVSQKTLLFSGTIASNIRYANESASDEEVENFLKTAQGIDIIKQNEKGYEMAVSQGGANLSGGQKQRLAIARALASKPEIFIFDDSFSALDYTTDAALRKALRRQTKDATVLIVTQRISTIMNSDQIVVLDKGEIVGIGKHKELMDTCEVYREIAESQLTEEELSR